MDDLNPAGAPDESGENTEATPEPSMPAPEDETPA